MGEQFIIYLTDLWLILYLDSVVDVDGNEYEDVVQRPSRTHLKEHRTESRPHGPSLIRSSQPLLIVYPLLSPAPIPQTGMLLRVASNPCSVLASPVYRLPRRAICHCASPVFSCSAVRAEIRSRGDLMSSRALMGAEVAFWDVLEPFSCYDGER